MWMLKAYHNSEKVALGHLLEVVERWQDDLMASSDETDSSKQLEDQGFCPESAGEAAHYNPAKSSLTANK